MKALIVYYSFTGNTERVAGSLWAILKVRGEVAIQRLVPVNETENFFAQCIQARLGKRVELKEGVSFNISEYDLLCIGTPV